MSTPQASDAVVIGGGLVGAAIAYGLVRKGLEVVLLDEGDVAYRASRGNFALVWVQGKGDGQPAYTQWTRASASEWPEEKEPEEEPMEEKPSGKKSGGGMK